MLEAIKQHDHSFAKFALAQSQHFAEHFKRNPPSAEVQTYFEQLAQTSIAEQTAMEDNQTGSFDEFIEDYRSRTSSQICCEGLIPSVGS